MGLDRLWKKFVAEWVRVLRTLFRISYAQSLGRARSVLRRSAY
jgi:hypothetical protein